jgi:transcription termination/antitermination protein NusG
MHSSDQLIGFSEAPCLAALADDANGEQWFALQTRARHEKVVAQQLCDKAVTNFLPLVKAMHHWSDRQKTVELPLFSGYVFTKIAPRNDERVRVLRAYGALSFVGARGQGIPIPEAQIHAVRTVIEERVVYEAFPFLKIGQRVRVRNGALSGVEGILVSRSGARALIVSLDAINQSLRVRIEGYDVEPI